jgi:hypothetical protein
VDTFKQSDLNLLKHGRIAQEFQINLDFCHSRLFRCTNSRSCTRIVQPKIFRVPPKAELTCVAEQLGPLEATATAIASLSMLLIKELGANR